MSAPTQMPGDEPVDAGSSSHCMSSPPGVSGQPPPVHSPFTAAPLQLQLTLKSTHQRSPVKLDELQALFAPQSASFSHGSQLLPVPTQLPKRCAHVASPRS